MLIEPSVKNQGARYRSVNHRTRQTPRSPGRPFLRLADRRVFLTSLTRAQTSCQRILATFYPRRHLRCCTFTSGTSTQCMARSNRPYITLSGTSGNATDSLCRWSRTMKCRGPTGTPKLSKAYILRRRGGRFSACRWYVPFSSRPFDVCPSIGGETAAMQKHASRSRVMLISVYAQHPGTQWDPLLTVRAAHAAG